MIKDLVWIVCAFLFTIAVVVVVIREKRPGNAKQAENERVSKKSNMYGGSADMFLAGIGLATFTIVYSFRAWGQWDLTVPLLLMVAITGARLADLLRPRKSDSWLPIVFVLLASAALAL